MSGFRIAETVRIKSGAFAGFTGIVEETDSSRLSLIVIVDIFGRRIPVEVLMAEVEKVENDPPRRSGLMNLN
jgi:transcription termination/antitermination protein NusG